MIASRWIWISHASTPAMRRSIFPKDEPLDVWGVKSAHLLAGAIGRADQALVSPELRARQTAEALELSAQVDPLLRDWECGQWAGRRLDEISMEDPNAVKAWLNDPEAASHGGESLSALLERIASWLNVHSGDKGQSIVISHPAVIRAVIVHSVQATPKTFWHIDIQPLSRTVLTRHDGKWRLRAIEQSG